MADRLAQILCPDSHRKNSPAALWIVDGESQTGPATVSATTIRQGARDEVRDAQANLIPELPTHGEKIHAIAPVRGHRCSG